MANRTGPTQIGKREAMFGLGLLAGGLMGLILYRRQADSGKMPHIDAWQRVLAENGRSEEEAAAVAARAQKRYEELYATRRRIASRALRNHLEDNILPGLALYQALREQGDDRETVLEEMESLFGTAFGKLNAIVPVVVRLPGAFDLFRKLTPLGMRLNFPREGWDIEWLENHPGCLAFNMHSCFYLDVLTAYDAPELTPLYCKMDDLLFEQLPSSIVWERTKTLGRGDEVCNFRWRRATQK